MLGLAPEGTIQAMIVKKGGPAAWTPANLGANGVAWFDPTATSTITLNSGNVSSWASSIGAAVVSQATAVNQPLYNTTGINGKSTLNGASGTAFLTGGNIVVPQQNLGVFAFIKYPSGASQMVVSSDVAGNFRADFAIDVTTGFFDYHDGNGNQVVGPNLFGAGHIVGIHSIAGTVTPRLDGTAFATSTSGSGSTSSTGIGSFAQSPGGNFLGDIGDVVYMQSPTLSQVQKLEGYLAWKWGVVANLPGGHPYKSRAPLVSDP